jgi:hypothetical protein
MGDETTAKLGSSEYAAFWQTVNLGGLSCWRACCPICPALVGKTGERPSLFGPAYSKLIRAHDRGARLGLESSRCRGWVQSDKRHQSESHRAGTNTPRCAAIEGSEIQSDASR